MTGLRESRSCWKERQMDELISATYRAKSQRLDMVKARDGFAFSNEIY